MNCSHAIDYTATDAIRKFFADYAHTVACIAQNHSDEATNKARLLLKQFGVKIASLSEINNTGVLSLIEENDLYEINAANISKLIKGQNLALDIVKSQSAHAFNYICKHLHDYLGAVEASEATPYTIENGDSFAEVLNSIGGQDASVVDMVVAKVSNDCLIEDITSVNETTWDALIGHVRVSNTIHNALNYFIKNDQSLNGNLGNYLDTAQDIVGTCEEEEHKTSKSALATALLNTQSMSLERKMTLVNELDLKEYLAVENIQAEGDIFGRLLNDDIIEDSAASFNQLVDKTWSSRESYIAHSSEFLSYITELTVKTEDLSKIPGSLIVPNEIKNYFLNNALAYKDLLSADGKEHLASYALEGKFALSADILTLLVDYLSPEKRLQCLITSRSKLSREDVVGLLPRLGGEYIKLAQPGKRPLFEDNELNKELLEWLRSLSVVNTINQERGKLRANIKASI